MIQGNRQPGESLRTLAAVLFLFVCGLSVIAAWAHVLTHPKTPPTWGATFSASYSHYLGSDWKQAYEAVLSDLGIRHVRLPVEWSAVEPQEGIFQWDDLDWMLEQARQSGAFVTLAIGRKVPRWPECYLPSWTLPLSESDRENRLLAFERAAVQRYGTHPSVERWQVENESTLPFGTCPMPQPGLLQRELQAVHSSSALPAMVTASGEWDPWVALAPMADGLGVSLYRGAWQPAIGFVTYPFPVWYYWVRGSLVRALGGRVFVSELQAEPWFARPPALLSGRERSQAFSTEELLRNAEFASAVGMEEVYVWGVEWWYAEKEAGRPQLWNAARFLFHEK